MSALSVYDMVGESLDFDALFVQHDPSRTATLSGVTGTFQVGEVLSFGTSGAVGEVLAWDGGTNLLTYALTSIQKPVLLGVTTPWLPVVGEVVTGGTSAATGSVAVDAAVGDSFPNDARTMLFVNNALATPVDLLFMPGGPCSHGFLHVGVATVAGGKTGPIGPFTRQAYNKPNGLLRIAYAGTTTSANLGVVAARVFKGQ